MADFSVTGTELYSQFIHLSRYARWLPEEGRRETWDETVSRYINFMRERFPDIDEETFSYLKEQIKTFNVMPSMRALMTAGKALERDNAASFNCSGIVIDNPRAFDELMYILMCFHPDTEIITDKGKKTISKLGIGDQVLSYDEENKVFVWEKVLNVVENSTSNKEKLELEFEDGSRVKCTSDHKFLTENRGWVEAKNLDCNDEIVSPKFKVYKVTNTETMKEYVGYTSFSVEERFRRHIAESFSKGSVSYDTYFHRSIRKYGKDVWSLETVDFAYTVEEAHKKEMSAISVYNTKNNGYNSTDGGEGTTGHVWTEEQRINASRNAYERTSEHRERLRKTIKKSHEKINETRKTEKYRNEQRERNLGERNPRYGKTHTDEWKLEASFRNTGKGNSFYGRSHSSETKKRLSDLKKGTNSGSENPFYGKTHSLEARKKMSETKRRKREERTKESV